MIVTVTPLISVVPHRQAVVQRETSRLTGAHSSHGCRQGCCLCSLPVSALAAFKEPYCARHERRPTVADARPTLRRHVPRLIAPLLFSTNVGAASTPHHSHPPPAILRWATRHITTRRALLRSVLLWRPRPYRHTPLLSPANVGAIPPPPSHHGTLATRMCCRAPL